MRAFVDSILSFINSWSLSDEEYQSLEIDEQAYTVETYTAIKTILEGRESVSTYVSRLTAYFTAKGIDVGDGTITAKSEILIGDCL